MLCRRSLRHATRLRPQRVGLRAFGNVGLRHDGRRCVIEPVGPLLLHQQNQARAQHEDGGNGDRHAPRAYDRPERSRPCADRTPGGGADRGIEPGRRLFARAFDVQAIEQRIAPGIPNRPFIVIV
jgi:hypothetical protein